MNDDNLTNSSILKTFSFIIILLTGIYSCKTVPPFVQKVKFNVNNEVERCIDSLNKNDVDTFFVYRKGCFNCYTTPYIGSRKEERKGVKHLPRQASIPAYVFWKMKGKYYIKKIDEFSIYETIERWEEVHYPIYDFFMNSVDLETIYARKWNSKDSDEKQNDINQVTIWDTTEKKEMPLDKPFSDKTIIHFKIADSLYKEEYDEVYFNVLTEEQERQEMVKWKEAYPSDSIIITNSKEHYEIHRKADIYLWMKMVESELFETEMRKLWIHSK